MARILIVDDAAITRAMLRGILEKAGHQVAEAADGDAAIAAFRETPAQAGSQPVYPPASITP